MTLQAFHNDELIQQKYITRVENHYKLDEIIKGEYWIDGKGCAVGCILHSNNHHDSESELGIPTWLFKLIDVLFEGLPNDKAKEFPLKFLCSIPIGFENWEHILKQIYAFMLKCTFKNLDIKNILKTMPDVKTLSMTISSIIDYTVTDTDIKHYEISEELLRLLKAGKK